MFSWETPAADNLPCCLQALEMLSMIVFLGKTHDYFSPLQSTTNRDGRGHYPGVRCMFRVSVLPHGQHIDKQGAWRKQVCMGWQRQVCLHFRNSLRGFQLLCTVQNFPRGVPLPQLGYKVHVPAAKQLPSSLQQHTPQSRHGCILFTQAQHQRSSSQASSQYRGQSHRRLSPQISMSTRQSRPRELSVHLLLAGRLHTWLHHLRSNRDWQQ